MDVLNPAAAGVIADNLAARTPHVGGSWHAQLDAKARDKNTSMIFKALKKHLPMPDPDVPGKLRGIAERCEDKIYHLSTNQANYERNIFRAILKMEDIKRKHHRADDCHAYAMQATTRTDIQQNQLSTLRLPVQASVQLSLQSIVGQHRHPQTSMHQQPPVQQTQQAQQTNIPLLQQLMPLQRNLQQNQLICRENNIVQLQQQVEALAPANSLIMHQIPGMPNQQAIRLQPENPGYGDASVPQDNMDNFNNRGVAFHNSPSATNLDINGRTSASDAGNPTYALYSSSDEAQIVHYEDNVDREHTIGRERTVIIQRSKETVNRSLFEHCTYVALFIEDYNMEFWNREHITNTVSSIAKPNTADPICISGIGYSAVLITVKADSIAFSSYYTVEFKNRDGIWSFRRVNVVLTENNDDSDDVTNSEQVEQSNDSPIPLQPLVDPNQPCPSSDPGAMPHMTGLQPVPIGQLRGQILHPAVHGDPITSKPKVDVKMYGGYFKVSAQGRGGESCEFRIPMQPLMDEGSTGLLMANICTGSVGFITEIGTTDRNHDLTVTVDVLARGSERGKYITLSLAQLESLCVKSEDPLPKLQLLTSPKMETGTAEKFELPDPFENCNTSSSADPVFSDLGNIIETSPSTTFSDDEQNPMDTVGHLDVDESWPELPAEQRLQDEKGNAKTDLSEDIPPYHPKYVPYEKCPRPLQPINEIDVSFDCNGLLNLDAIQDPPASDDTQMESCNEEVAKSQSSSIPSSYSADHQNHQPPLSDHHNALPSQAITGTPLHSANSAFVTSPSPPITPSHILLHPEFTRADGSQANAPTQVPTQTSATERTIGRLLEALRGTQQQHLSVALSDLRTVFTIARSTPCDGFRAALGEDHAAVAKSQSRANNFILRYEEMGTSKNMKRTNYCPELQSTTISHMKRQKVSGNSSLMEEIEEINRNLIDTELHVCQDDADLLTASTSEGAEGTVIKFTFTAVAVCHSLKSMFASGKLGPISLRLRVPAIYPECSPVILDNFPNEQRTSDDLNTKALSKFSTLVQDLREPTSLEQIATTWDACVREVIVEYAQQTGGGSITSTYGQWEDCAGA